MKRDAIIIRPIQPNGGFRRERPGGRRVRVRPPLPNPPPTTREGA